MAGLVALGYVGANVTIPHKTAVLAYCDELDPFAERAGSANTLVVRDGRVLASSTDGLAVADAVDAAAGARIALARRGRGGPGRGDGAARGRGGCARRGRTEARRAAGAPRAFTRSSPAGRSARPMGGLRTPTAPRSS